MTIPPRSDDIYVNQLYDDIRKELVGIFSLTPDQAYELLANFYSQHPEYNDDHYFHEGPFSTAVKLYYGEVLGRDVRDPEFLEWRKTYNDLWNERRK